MDCKSTPPALNDAGRLGRNPQAGRALGLTDYRRVFGWHLPVGAFRPPGGSCSLGLVLCAYVLWRADGCLAQSGYGDVEGSAQPTAFWLILVVAMGYYCAMD